MKHDARWGAAIALVWAILLAFVLYPSLAVVWESLHTRDGAFTLAHYAAFFDYAGHPQHLESLAGSLWIAFGSVVLCALIGVPLAFIFSLYRFPGRDLFAALAVLPITLPPIVGVVAFYYLFGGSGILTRLMEQLLGDDRWPLVADGFTGVFLVHAYTMYVFFYLFTSAALQQFDQSLVDASRNLGASRWRTWWRVYVPALLPSLTAAALLVFMTALASFSAPYIFAPDRPILVLQIFYNKDVASTVPLAQAQTVVLSVVSLTILLFLRGANRRGGSPGKGARFRAREVRSGGTRALAGVLGVGLTLLLLLPHLTVFWLSFVKPGSWRGDLFPDQYTLINYTEMFRSAEFFEPIRNSLLLSVLATAGTLVVGVILSYLLVRGRFRGQRAMELAAMLPWALPGTVVAVNLLTAFSTWWAGTMWILVLAYFVRYLPLILRSGVAALQQVELTLEDAARNLGGSTVRVFRTVTLPLMAPGLLAGGLLVFVSCLGEFVASIMLWNVETKPISVEIYNQLLRSNNVGMACAYSMVLIVAVTAVILATRRWAARGIA